MRYCPNCESEVYDDAIRCNNCQRDLPKVTLRCSRCNAEKTETLFIRETEYCLNCADIFLESIIITTTPNIEGKRVLAYLGIESAEVVIGTGIWSEMSSDFHDFFGQRSTEFEKKLQRAKALAIKKVKYLAAMKGANAVVGVDIDYTEFSGNRIGVVASGTIVCIEI